MAKTLTFGAMHVATSFGVAYAITGNMAVSGAVTFVEPAVNTVMHYFFDKFWDRNAHSASPPVGLETSQASTSAA